MKVGYFGSGTWGFALASILGKNGHDVLVFVREEGLAKRLQEKREHPHLAGIRPPPSVRFTSDLAQVAQFGEVWVESVTSLGVRPILEAAVAHRKGPLVPTILTSKGLEEESGLLLPEIAAQILQDPSKVGALSGPSHAEEVIQNMPTSIVCSSYDLDLCPLICDLFSTPTLRIYPNRDLHGVCFGGAMKNIIAIACGISDGLTHSDNAKAALMTRGLHEMRKLAFVKGCDPETLNGLSGMGDLSVTCLSRHSRNSRFGKLIAEGFSLQEALEKIGMAVEGVAACRSIRALGKKHQVPLPITEAIFAILYEGMSPRDAVRQLLTRAVKEERL